MSVQAFLTQLDALGVQLFAADGKLRCKAPDGVMTPELKARLAADKMEILELLQSAAETSAIPRANPENQTELALSSAERRYWTLEQLASSAGAYNMALPYSVRGPLDTDSLQRSIELLVNRHQVLRSRFPLTDAGPVRLLDAPLPELEKIDLRKDKTFKQAHMDRILWGPFDLSQGPLLRFAVLQEEEDSFLLLFSIHHMVFDGASFRIFCAELTHYYASLTHSITAEMPELPIQYSDYSLWEKKRLDSAWLDRELDYWRGQLEPVPESLALGRQKTGDAGNSRLGARQDFRVSLHDMDRVRAFARKHAASVYMVMLSVFDVLLWQLTSQREFILGVPVSNRQLPELEGLIGNFSNTLALRQALEEQDSFTSLLNRVRNATLDGYQHTELPIETLVSHLRLEQHGRSSNFLSVMFDLQATTLSAFELPGVETVGLRTEKGSTMLDFSLVLVPEGDELQGAIEYHTGSFQRAEIQAAADHFVTLLRAVLSDPEQSLSQLPSMVANHGSPHPAFLPAKGGGKIRAGYVPARNNLEFHLVKLWEDLLGCPGIGVHDNFFERGGHSLLALRLVQRVEEMTGKRLSIDFLWLEEPTIDRLAHRLSCNEQMPDWRRAVTIQAGADRPPLFVVHTTGGHLYRYYELAKYLDPQQPVYGLNARGVYGDEVPHSDVRNIAEDCISSMRAQQPHGPYHIAGECMAGATAYEMACQLRQQGQTVNFVGLLESYAQGMPYRHPLRAFFYQLRSYEDRYVFQEAIYHYLLNRLGFQHLRKLRKLTEAQRWANWSYRPGRYDGEVHVFATAASQRGCGDDTLCWGQAENMRIKTHSMPGNHGSMMEPPNVESVAEVIKACLEECRQKNENQCQETAR